MSSRHPRTLLLAAFAVSAALFTNAPASAASIYTYGFLASLPCAQGSCIGNVGLSGTMSVNQLSTLSLANLIDWNFTIVQGSSSITLTRKNSEPQFSGNPGFTATATDLIITVTKAGDGFAFLGYGTPVGEWIYAGQNSGQLLNVGGMVGFQRLTLPATFTATRLSATLTPEPAAFLLVGIGIASLLLASEFLGVRFRSSRLLRLSRNSQL